MDIVTLLFTAAGLAMDAFSVSISGGIFIKQYKTVYALKMGLFFGVFQFMMPCLGWLLGYGFVGFIEKYAPWVAFGLLIFIGGKMILEAIHPKTEEVADPLDNKLLTLLAVATSIDALAVGVTFAAMNLNVIHGGLGFALIPNAAVIGVVAFIISSIGVYIGNKSGNIFGNKAEIAGGLVLIVIGIKILAQSFI